MSTHPHKLDTKDDVRTFLYAGKAKITVKNVKTGGRFTYQVKEAKDGKLRFVSLLGGANNEADYRYIGLLFDDAKNVVLTKKSKATAGAPSVKAFNFLLKALNSPHDFPPAFEVWHEGYCGRCGRLLTVPESIANGIGPVCAGKG